MPCIYGSPVFWKLVGQRAAGRMGKALSCDTSFAFEPYTDMIICVKSPH